MRVEAVAVLNGALSGAQAQHPMSMAAGWLLHLESGARQQEADNAAATIETEVMPSPTPAEAPPQHAPVPAASLQTSLFT